MFTRFEDIEAWRYARVLCGEMYRVSGKEPFAKDFGQRDQIRSARVDLVEHCERF